MCSCGPSAEELEAQRIANEGVKIIPTSKSIIIANRVTFDIKEIGKINPDSTGDMQNRFYKLTIDSNIFILYVHGDGHYGIPCLVKIR